MVPAILAEEVIQGKGRVSEVSMFTARKYR
jgi:hypothetical protein